MSELSSIRAFDPRGLKCSGLHELLLWWGSLMREPARLSAKLLSQSFKVGPQDWVFTITRAD